MAEGQESYIISAEFDNKGTKQAKKEFEEVERTVENASDGIDSSLKKIGAAVGGAFAVQQLKEFASKIVDARAEIEKYEVSFRTLLGDRQLADDFFGEIRNFAVNTPLMLKDLASGAQTMLGFNIEAEKVIPTMQQIGDIAMGDQQKFQSLTLAFSQMSATGKLMGQDLLQMINSGFNPLTEISRTTGKSISELKEEMEKGKISAEMVADAFKSATSEGGQFYGMLESQSKTIAGAMSNLQGAIDDALNSLGESAQPIITSTISGLTSVAKHLDDIGKAFLVLISTVGAYKAASLAASIFEQIKALGSLTQAIKSTTVAQAALNAVMKANPYALAVSAIAAAATAMIAFSDNTSDEEKALESLRKEQEEYNNDIKSQRDEVDQLLRVVQDETKIENERNDALITLQGLYPTIFEQYNTAIELTNNLSNAQECYNNLLREQSALQGKKKYEFDKSLLDKIRGIKSRGGDSHDLNTNLTDEEKKYLTNAGVGLLGAEKYLTTRLNAQNAKRAKDSQSDYLSSLSGKTKKELDSEAKHWEALQKQMNTAGKKYIETQDGLVLSYEQVTQRLKAAAEQRTEIDKFAGKSLLTSSKKAYDDAVKEQKRLIKMAKSGNYGDFKNKEEFDKALADAEANVKSTKEQYEKYGGTTKKDSKSENAKKKAEEAANEKKVELAARARAAKEYERKLQHEEEVSLLEREKNRIELEEKGFKKERSMLHNEYDKTIADIRDKEQQMIKAAQDEEEKNWQADNPDYKKKGLIFSPTAGLTKEQEKLIQGELEAAGKKLADGLRRINEEQDAELNEYFANYGTYAERIAAINAKYQKLIDDAKSEGREGAALTYQKDWKKALEDVNVQFGVTTQLMADLFGDASKKSIKEIKVVVSKYEELVEYLQGGKKADARSALISSGKFTDNELSRIEEQLNTGVIKLKDVVDSLAEKKGTLPKLDKWLDDVEDAVDKISNGDIPEGLGKGISVLQDAAQQIKEWGDTICRIFSLDSSDFDKVMGGVSGALQTGEGVAKMFSGDFVGGISDSLNGIADLVDAFRGGNIEKLQKQVDNLIISNNALSQQMSLLSEEFKKSNTNNILDNYEKLQKNIEAQERNLQKMMATISRQWNSGSHSLNRQFSNDTLDQLNRALHTSFGDLAELLASVTSKQWQALFNDPDTYGALEREIKRVNNENNGDAEAILGYIRQMAEMAKNADGYADDIKSKFVGMTFESMFSSWKSTLMDMSSSLADFSRNAGKMISDALINKVADDYENQFRPLYDSLYEAVKSNNTSEVLRVKAEIEQLSAQAREQVREMEQNGIISNQSTISASTKSVASMSEDTASELNGRFTAIQISNANIESFAQVIADNISFLANISASMESGNGILRDINASILACSGTLNSIYNTNVNGFTSLKNAIDGVTSAINNKL